MICICIIAILVLIILLVVIVIAVSDKKTVVIEQRPPIQNNQVMQKHDRYCPDCGRAIPFDANICPYCSKKFKVNK